MHQNSSSCGNGNNNDSYVNSKNINNNSTSSCCSYNDEKNFPTETFKNSLKNVNDIYLNYYNKQKEERMKERLNILKRQINPNLGYKNLFSERLLVNLNVKKGLQSCLQNCLQNMTKSVSRKKRIILIGLLSLFFIVKFLQKNTQLQKYFTQFMFNKKIKTLQNNIFKNNLQKKYFSLIEILIAISIIVTFSGLTGTVYYEKLIDTKIAYTKIELNLILQQIYLYYSINNIYPIKLQDINNITTIVTNKDLLDPFNQQYLYIPKIDWLSLIDYLNTNKNNNNQNNNLNNTNLINYFIECLNQLILIISNIDLDNKLLLCASAKEPIVFSLGYRKPIFVQELEKDNLEMVMNWIKIVREKSVSFFLFF